MDWFLYDNDLCHERVNYKVLRLRCMVSHGVSGMCFSIEVKCRHVVDMTLTSI